MFVGWQRPGGRADQGSAHLANPVSGWICQVAKQAANLAQAIWWVLLKKMENLENGQSKVPIALDALVASSPATVQGGRTKICEQVHSVFPEYIAPAPVASYATPASISFAAPAPVVDRISPDFTVHAVPDPVMEPAPMEYVSPAPAVHVAPAHVGEHIAPAPTPVTVAKHITPAPAVHAATVSVEEYIAPAPAASFAVPVPTPVTVVEHISPAPAGYAARVPVLEYIAPAPTPVPVVEHISSAPAGYDAPASVVEYFGPAPAASPVVEHISSAPAVYAAKAPMVELSLLRQWRATPRRQQCSMHELLSWNTFLSRSYGVCRTSSCGGAHRSSTSGKLWRASAYSF